jgi:hypothetical protein
VTVRGHGGIAIRNGARREGNHDGGSVEGDDVTVAFVCMVT